MTSPDSPTPPMSAPSHDRPAAGTVEVTMPETGSEAGTRIVLWLKRPGQPVAHDEPLCLVEWDGNRAAVTSPAAGVLRMIAVGAGEAVPVGISLAIVDVGLGGGSETSDAAPERPRRFAPEQHQPPAERV